MNTLNIDYNLIKQQREHLLSHVWHDSKCPPQPIEEEVAWGIIELMDDLLNQQDSEKNEIFC